MPNPILNNPPTGELLDMSTVQRELPLAIMISKVALTRGWQVFFSQLWQIALSVTLSGTTAQRPTSFLWVGRFYFDTTLTKPVWIKSVSGGVATWCDATGATV